MYKKILISIIVMPILLCLSTSLAIANDSKIEIGLPLAGQSLWHSAIPSNDQNLNYLMVKTNGANQLFAVKDKTFVKTSSNDTWFVYGLFGKVQALSEPGSPKYQIWQGKHNAIDFSAPIGTPVISATNGEVVFADEYIGNTIIIKCQDELYVTYGHLNKVYTKIGDKVTIGEAIGEVGNSGGVINPHLHFEIDQRIENHTFMAINPANFYSLNDFTIPEFSVNQYAKASDADNFYWINPLADMI